MTSLQSSQERQVWPGSSSWDRQALEDWKTRGAGWGSVVVRGVRVLGQWKNVLKYFQKHPGRLIFFYWFTLVVLKNPAYVRH